MTDPHGGVMTDPQGTEDPFAILSDVERSAAPVRVLKDDDSFAVFDLQGDIVAGSSSQHGLYHRGTRFVSDLTLLLATSPPLLLSSTISQDNVVFTADLTNSDIRQGSRLVLPRGSVHLYRARVLDGPTLVESLRITNHSLRTLEVPLTWRLAGDYADVFEVRGTTRAARGRQKARLVDADVLWEYRGLDGVERRTRIHPTEPPDRRDEGALFYLVALSPHQSAEIEIGIGCEIATSRPSTRRCAVAVGDRRQNARAEDERGCSIVTSNHVFNRWLQRSRADLRMMITETPYGRYPYAGIPWFATPFGRDGLIAALELLWAAPEVARGVLMFLARTQATEENLSRDAHPGKILHEMRDGEMAALGEVPFGRYYGSVDATPLFVTLLHAYFERTADRALVDELWPHLLAALDWIDRYGDIDGDEFVEYVRHSETGLVQQGWKDSWDSVFHADGTLAAAPIALCEVQGYVFSAWQGAAALAAMRGEQAQADEWRQRARRLKANFEERFWVEALGTYALALDADKRPCRVRTSNAGHCLYSGIARPLRARRVAATLMADSSFTGWGIRTVDAAGARYNPMSYHNGSVWPHDNALISAGFARYGLTGESTRVIGSMFDLSQVVDLYRLPELICGFHRRPGDAPTLYPVACAPQTWAAGAVYLLLQACLGLRIDGVRRLVHFDQAMVPESIDWIRLLNLRVGESTIDLLVTRYEHGTGVTVLRRDGTVEVATRN